MKIIITQHSDGHAEVVIRDAGGINLHCYTFDDIKQARVFCMGWRCCQMVVNSVVQSLPMMETVSVVA